MVPENAEMVNGALVEHTRVGVVVPAHQASAHLAACLDGVLASGAPAGDILVVDDGSTDGTGDIARARGIEVLRNDVAERPAWARNRGVAALDREVILFVDADVIPAPDVYARVEEAFDADPDLAALFGSYDAAPPAPGVVSRYRNLLHHFVHQSSGGPAGTFWTGLGAVRRTAFLAVGGLDRDWENIEDVEFGMRLAAAGHAIRLDPSLQGTHLKHWTARSAFRTDLYGRAVPWTRLLVFRGAKTGSLNTGTAAKLGALGLVAAGVGLVASPFAPAALWGVLAGFGVFVAGSGRFFAFLARTRGFGFAVRAVPAHALYTTAALAGFGLVWLREGLPHRLGLTRS